MTLSSEETVSSRVVTISVSLLTFRGLIDLMGFINPNYSSTVNPAKSQSI